MFGTWPHRPLAQPCHQPWLLLTIKTLLKALGILVPCSPYHHHLCFPNACLRLCGPSPTPVACFEWRPHVAKPPLS